MRKLLFIQKYDTENGLSPRVAQATVCARAVDRFRNPLAVLHPGIRQFFISVCAGATTEHPPRIQTSDCHDIATGYRHNDTGALASVGASGYAWSSSSFGGTVPRDAGNLNFNATWVNPLNNNARSNGFPVRCVQHLRPFSYLDFLPDGTENSSPTRSDGGQGLCQSGG